MGVLDSVSDDNIFDRAVGTAIVNAFVLKLGEIRKIRKSRCVVENKSRVFFLIAAGRSDDTVGDIVVFLVLYG